MARESDLEAIWDRRHCQPQVVVAPFLGAVAVLAVP